MDTHQMPYEEAWVYAGGRLNEYAHVLKYRYPFAYIRHYLLLNAKQIFYPQKSMINRWDIYRSPLAVEWYAIPERNTVQTHKGLPVATQKQIARIANALLWLCVLGTFVVGIYNWKNLHFTGKQCAAMAYLFLFGGAFLGLCLLAHPLNARYMMVVYIVQVTLPYLLIQRLWDNRFTGGRTH